MPNTTVLSLFKPLIYSSRCKNLVLFHFSDYEPPAEEPNRVIENQHIDTESEEEIPSGNSQAVNESVTLDPEPASQTETVVEESSEAVPGPSKKKQRTTRKPPLKEIPTTTNIPNPKPKSNVMSRPKRARKPKAKQTKTTAKNSKTPPSTSKKDSSPMKTYGDEDSPNVLHHHKFS